LYISNCIVFFAACLRKYPFEGRVILFLTPFFIIFLVEGYSCILKRSYRFRFFFAFILISLAMYKPVQTAVHFALNDRASENSREAVQYLGDHVQPKDKIMINVSARFAYWYYGMKYKVPVKFESFTEVSDSGEIFDSQYAQVFFDGVYDVDGQDVIGMYKEYHLYKKTDPFKRS
jgi:hypothetical protein